MHRWRRSHDPSWRASRARSACLYGSRAERAKSRKSAEIEVSVRPEITYRNPASVVQIALKLRSLAFDFGVDASFACPSCAREWIWRYLKLMNCCCRPCMVR
eukprot:2392963-Rhodomonas_salina.1